MLVVCFSKAVEKTLKKEAKRLLLLRTPTMSNENEPQNAKNDKKNAVTIVDLSRFEVNFLLRSVRVLRRDSILGSPSWHLIFLTFFEFLHRKWPRPAKGP